MILLGIIAAAALVFWLVLHNRAEAGDFRQLEDKRSPHDKDLNKRRSKPEEDRDGLATWTSKNATTSDRDKDDDGGGDGWFTD